MDLVDIMELVGEVALVDYADKDVLRTAGYKEEQLSAALKPLKKKANKFRLCISGAILTSRCTKSQIIKLKYKAEKSAA